MSVIRLLAPPLSSIEDARDRLQTALEVEFATLPPYLYAAFTLRPDANDAARQCLHDVYLQEMVHLGLACNILNSLGGEPRIRPPVYPGPVPGGIGADGTGLLLHLHPFSRAAMQQAMDIEQPDDPPEFPERQFALAAEDVTAGVSIGQFYDALDAFLAELPASAWVAGRRQLTDGQFLTGQVFAVNGYDDAHRAISSIVSEGEGSRQATDYDPLDFQGELAHYFRFGEIFHDRVLTRTPGAPPGYAWGPERLGIDWTGAYPALTDPALHDFSTEPAAARAAQAACDHAFTRMVDALQSAVTGAAGAWGDAVRAMFDLRTAALTAVTVPLADGVTVSGPAFRYLPASGGGTS